MNYRASDLPIAHEAWPFAAPLALAMLLAAFYGMNYWAFFLLICFVYVLVFFRNPVRSTPMASGVVVAPADGKVVAAGIVAHPAFEDGQALRIAVFMSLFDCHINWAPFSGEIVSATHHCGKFLNAMEDKSCEENERKILMLRTPDGMPVEVRLVAGLVARRIVCPLDVKDWVYKGEKIGLIRFGSRVEVLVPAHCALEVSPGARVIGGETILAVVPGQETQDTSVSGKSAATQDQAAGK